MDRFGFKRGQPIVWYHQDRRKGNQNCLYCGVFVGAHSTVPSDKEHLIGRNFVPSGSFAGSRFNFIFRSCRSCNAEKALAERHASSVTLFNSSARIRPSIDTLARRKAEKDFHPRKRGVPIKDAGDTHSVSFVGAGLSVSFEMTSPPQLDSAYWRSLASFHVQALFSLITTKDPRVPADTSLLDPELIHYFGNFPETDWGNARLLEVVQRSSVWPCYANINAAGGYFKAVLRRSPENSVGWFWALEWNRSTRVIGTIGMRGKMPELFHHLPDPDWIQLPGNRRMYAETALPPENDTLFSAKVQADLD